MADDDRPSFDLTEQRWILVHRLDGRVDEVSIRQLIAEAHALRGIVGELPTQTFAIVRLLLAILHRAVDGPPTGSDWATLWQMPTLPAVEVDAYLHHVRDRFDLLHPEQPFYQVAALHTEKDEWFGLKRLIADVPTRHSYFTTRLKSGVDRISFGEAARWIVHCQAFDPAGIKSGAVGDSRVRKNKGYGSKVGWAGAVGGVIAEGATLRETLMLNTIPDDIGYLDASVDDIPVWERPPQTAAEESDAERPYGPLDLYTWQSRRMRLFGDHEGVFGVLIANGDKLAPDGDQLRKEPMSAWRRSSAEEKRSRRPVVYMPRGHDPERAVWRGLAALLPGYANAQQGSDASPVLAPGVLKWIGQAQSEGLLDPSYRVRTRAIGISYARPNRETIEEIIDDAVSVAVVLLSQSHPDLAVAAVGAAEDAEHGANALGNLAANLAEAAGGDGSGPRNRAREVAYAQLDSPFRSWLAEFGPETDPLGARREWQRTARDVLRGLGRDLVDQSGPAAWVGRDLSGRHVSTPEADGWYRAQLRKVFELAYKRREAEVKS